VAADPEHHAVGLLDWLYDVNDGAEPAADDLKPYLDRHDLDRHFGFQLVRLLVENGLVDDASTLGGADAIINHRGIVAVQRRRAELKDPVHRAAALRSRMLLWLEVLDKSSETPADWEDFVASDQMVYGAETFTAREVARAAEYLQHHNLISSMRVDQAPDGMIRPTLTVEGHTCLTDFGGSVADYLSRGQHVANTTNTTFNVADNHGNMAMANENVVQNLSQGLDVTKVLELAGLTRQISSTLGLPEETRHELDDEAEELHAEAESTSPDVGKMRRGLNTIGKFLAGASSTAAKTLLLGLAEAATKSITGG
jgi:hypothetical protein